MSRILSRRLPVVIVVTAGGFLAALPASADDLFRAAQLEHLEVGAGPRKLVAADFNSINNHSAYSPKALPKGPLRLSSPESQPLVRNGSGPSSRDTHTLLLLHYNKGDLPQLV